MLRASSMIQSDQQQSWGTLAKGLVALFVVVGIIVLFVGLSINFLAGIFGGMLPILSSLDAAIIVALITGCVSIVTVIGGAIANNCLLYHQRKKEYLRNHREPTYQKLIEIVYKLLTKSKKNEIYTQNEMLDDMNEFSQALTLWGSSKAIRLWDDWRLLSINKKPNPKELLLAMEKVLIQLRKDMGQDGGIRQGDLLKLFINDIDDWLKK